MTSSPLSADQGTLTFHDSEALLASLLETINDLPELPITDRDQMYPLQTFYHHEVAGYKEIVKTIGSDITTLLQVVKSETALSTNLSEVLHTLNDQCVPHSWMSQNYPSCPGLTQWLYELHTKMNQLCDYMKKDASVECYNLAVFNRPVWFLQTALQTQARKEFKPLYEYKIEIQVTTEIFS